MIKDEYFPDDSLSKSIGSIENDIKILRVLNHPLILKFYEYFLEYDPRTEKSYLAIVTDYCSVSNCYCDFKTSFFVKLIFVA